MKATDILNKAAGHIGDRAAAYDKPEGERSMEKTVSMFNTLTDGSMTTEQGWLFMALLKMVRSQQGEYKADNYEDGAAYFALAGEKASALNEGSRQTRRQQLIAAGIPAHEFEGIADLALDGIADDTPSLSLAQAFVWEDTKQGKEHWQSRMRFVTGIAEVRNEHVV